MTPHHTGRDFCVYTYPYGENPDALQSGLFTQKLKGERKGEQDRGRDPSSYRAGLPRLLVSLGGLRHASSRVGVVPPRIRGRAAIPPGMMKVDPGRQRSQ